MRLTVERDRHDRPAEPEGRPLLRTAGLTIASAGAGAVAEYLLDPDRGRSRRARIRDQAAHAAHDATDGLGGLSHDVANRGRGVAAGVRYRITGRHADDAVLHDRVRSELGRHLRHPHAVQVRAEDRVVTLTGDVLADEHERVVHAVKHVPGVKKVDAQWRVHDRPGDVPTLQGDGQRREPQPELLQQHWTPAARMLTGAVAVASWPLSRRLPAPARQTTRVAGAALALRAATNLTARRLTGINAGRRAVDLQAAITINARPEDIWPTVGDYTAFPRFMPDVREVRRSDDGRLSHWVVAGPAGTLVRYDAEETKRDEGREIAWKTIDGQLIAHTGTLRLDPVDDHRTRVQIQLTYNPITGAAGHVVATMLGANPTRKLIRSLQRLKTVIETGKPPSDATQPTGTTPSPPG